MLGIIGPVYSYIQLYDSLYCNIILPLLVMLEIFIHKILILLRNKLKLTQEFYINAFIQ